MAFKTGYFEVPGKRLSLPLAGQTVEVDPANPAELFRREYADLETCLSAHRFAWVPIAGNAVDADWTAALWMAWVDTFGETTGGWPWHAYTASERAINIIDFCAVHGLPGGEGDLREMLSRHAQIISANLEYYGDHYTSNHLANNGRGLLRIGCALGDASWASLGARILIAEAGRIFGRSGVLREGSSHYHLLLTRNYLDAWQAAANCGLASAGLLGEIVERAISVLPALTLPGGMPLIGDVSPDAPPNYLTDYIAAVTSGERRRDPAPDGSAVRWTQSATAPSTASPDRLAADGWHRMGSGEWSALTFASPDGWPPMPGHGHQDLGSFELHAGRLPVIVDPGRGSYREDKYHKFYASADAHNAVTVNGAAAMPVNRPYYSDDFRETVVPDRPDMQRTRNGLRLVHSGFTRLRGIGAASREWEFSDRRVVIRDQIDGTGRHTVRLTFCSPLEAVKEDGDTVRLTGGGRNFRLASAAEATLQPRTAWHAYGEGNPATAAVFELSTELPVDLVSVLELV